MKFDYQLRQPIMDAPRCPICNLPYFAIAPSPMCLCADPFRTMRNNITPDPYQGLIAVATAMYCDEPCRICGALITSADLHDLVFAGYSADNTARSAHLACWEQRPSDETQWKHP